MDFGSEATPGRGPFVKTRSRPSEPSPGAPLFSFPTPGQTDPEDDLLSEDEHQYSPSAITERPELCRAGRRGRKSTGFGALIGPGGDADMSVSPEPERAGAFEARDSVTPFGGLRGADGGQRTPGNAAPWHRDDVNEAPSQQGTDRKTPADVALVTQRDGMQRQGYRDASQHRVRSDNASEAYAALLRPTLRGEAGFASVLGGLHDLAQDLADRRGEMAAAQTRCGAWLTSFFIIRNKLERGL